VTVADDGDGAEHPGTAVGVTATAGAPPVLVTARLKVKTWPVFTVKVCPLETAGLRDAVRVALSAAGACTVDEVLA
jgi:hypothetical protein